MASDPDAVNPVAAAGFGRAADVYERSRPSYPADAVARLVSELDIRAGRRVLDLAAGTGKLTRLLAEHGAELVAVEPSAAMREAFVSVLPGVPVHEGTAEKIPLADTSVDAVVVAQAFHWFDAPRALVEIARVLRPVGGLALDLERARRIGPVGGGAQPRHAVGRAHAVPGRAATFVSCSMNAGSSSPRVANGSVSSKSSTARDCANGSRARASSPRWIRSNGRYCSNRSASSLPTSPSRSRCRT